MQADTTSMDSARAPASQAPQALPQGCTNFKLRQLMRRVATHYDAEMAKCGLKTTQYSLLSHVLKLGPIRPGDLAVAMKMDASTLTRNMQPLVAQGWLRIGAGEDARSRLVEITDAGRAKRVEGVEHLDKLVQVDQSPIGRTPRSNAATYTGVFDKIRKLFAETTEAKVRGYKAGRFSFNIKGGRCEACQGDGTLKIEMNFLPDVYVPCEVCNGARYNRETLEVHYKGKSIAEVLGMPISEAADFFEPISSIHRYLKTLVDVGLGYVRLGQSATTLSGGEAQRVKLASELQKRSQGRTVYILDEPTTGLHFEDVRKLMLVIQGLVEKGNSVIVIEHNLDVIKSADWVIDMGPEGGSGGGTVVAEGTPEDVAAVEGSYTGKFLAEVL